MERNTTFRHVDVDKEMSFGVGVLSYTLIG